MPRQLFAIKIAAIFLISCILISNFLLQNVYAETEKSNEPYVIIREAIWYECGVEYDAETQRYVYFENPGSRQVWINVFDSGKHNITLIMETEEELSYHNLFATEGEANISNLDGKFMINGYFKDSFFAYLRFETDHSDPLNLTLLPIDADVFPIDDQGFLSFEVALNVSCEISYVILRVDVEQGSKYVNWLENLKPGSYIIKDKIICNPMSTYFFASAHLPEFMELILTICIIDEEEVAFDHWGDMWYITEKKQIARALVPWVCGLTTYERFAINLTANKDFVLRIDPRKEEIVEYLAVTSDISDVKIEEEDVYGRTCYSFYFKFKSKSSVFIQLMIFDKVWFLRTSNMTLENIPEEIRRRYTNPLSSEYSKYIDRDSDIVKLWSKDVVGDVKNPYLIAYLLFENLTQTLKPSSEIMLYMKASKILKVKEGRCWHFAIAYAALCMASGLPVRLVTGNLISVGVFDSHMWNEIYLPKYGWITVDVSRNIFCVKSRNHLLYTSMSRYDDLDCIGAYSSEQLKWEDCKKTLLNLLSVCYEKVDKIAKQARFISFIPESVKERISKCYEKLGWISLLIENDIVHKALLEIAYVYITLNKVSSTVTILTMSTLCVITIIVSIIVVAIKRKRYLVRIGENALHIIKNHVLTCTFSLFIL